MEFLLKYEFKISINKQENEIKHFFLDLNCDIIMSLSLKL